MKILITGGAGYIGYSLVERLEQSDSVSDIIVYDNLYKKNTNFFIVGNKLEKTTFIEGDILNRYSLEKALEGVDIVIHLAGHVEFPYSYKDNYKYEQVNQYGTLSLVDLLKETDIQKLIYLSSASVYGYQKVKDENTPPRPANLYGSTKLEGEKYINLLRDECNISILRSANVFGINPLVRLDSVINKFFMEAIVYKKIRIHGDGSQQRPFIYLNHLIDEVAYHIDNSSEHVITNVCDGNLSINHIKNFITNQLPDTEFTYTNAGTELRGLEMQSKIRKKNSQDIIDILKKALNEFTENLRLHSR